MNLLLLPGNSPHNKAWIHHVDEVLAPLFNGTLVHDYAHWENGQNFIDFEHEIEATCQEVGDLEPYSIFAKSVGSILAIKAMAARSLEPRGCLFVGLPLQLVIDENIPLGDLLKDVKIPITIAQNDHDPIGGFQAVKAYFDKLTLPNITLVELSGDAHDYDDMAKVTKLASKLL
jgi:predicted alpha/beta-hydrolase family hydrolase